MRLAKSDIERIKEAAVSIADLLVDEALDHVSNLDLVKDSASGFNDKQLDAVSKVAERLFAVELGKAFKLAILESAEW